ncbi:inositol polyphosphate-4-phosphatase type I A isoform X2 [Neocloeon triangulifer]|uniref:inositol polyphosphate-4-phosphatase type I A isoform X2 n=1 Tax=Neocloeon triangulifer TaxID=2078957 RepID=UPI00286F0D75|nr:inositol polyphosphate-4-phosphatase type I A isoform X2 [Neocloeon triangulifer]
MRLNKQEMFSFAKQPSQNFDKEGVLLLKERQDGFFKRTEISSERWCRLRGNMLFYFKSREQWSEPAGVILVEGCSIKLEPATMNDGSYGFALVFEGGVSQHLAALSVEERDRWVAALQIAGYETIRAQITAMKQELDLRYGGREIELDVNTWRARRGRLIDPCEAPLCEVSFSCDNLLCDGHGKPPNPMLSLHVFMPFEGRWVQYGRTEVIKCNSNPNFLHTVALRASDGLVKESKLRISLYNVREPISQVATLLGRAELQLKQLIQDESGCSVRLALKSITPNIEAYTTGFVTASSWTLKVESNHSSTESTPCKSPLKQDPAVYSHRRSYSLPSRLGTKLSLPQQGELNKIYTSPFIRTYRFHSGLGGDICVHETMAESRMSFTFPQQLLQLWINDEKELLQEVAGMGELREPWHSKQIQLLDRHLHLLHMYSQAKQNLQNNKDRNFKPSCQKDDRSLEFVPINLHLQRMWVQNDTLRRKGLYDVITVGAFTSHANKCKAGGLLRLLQQMKESDPNINEDNQGPSKISMAHDTVQAIKQLRREVVESMRSLMKLAKEKQTQGMLPLCEEMIKKTKILLSLWDTSLVEEAMSFLEEFKVSSTLECDKADVLTPYRRITQQLLNFKPLPEDELLSPDLSTPVDERLRLINCWTTDDGDTLTAEIVHVGESLIVDTSSFQEIPLLCETEETVIKILDQDESNKSSLNDEVSPVAENEKDKETSVVDIVIRNDFNTDSEKLDEEIKQILPPDSGPESISRQFLDTQAMCNSPTANYYKPTDEPEPWDLTQLNIEASMMCLVSKVKFLCGRVGSPAVRLRAQNSRKMSTHSSSSDVSKDCDGNVKRINKFTDGLDFSAMVDWAAELRPPMRKLRQAMDGLLKTARLTHSVLRVQQDSRAAMKACSIQYRRDICFSQALTSLVSGLMAKLWCAKPDPRFLLVLSTLGPLVEFETLLSYHGDEIAMWGDMVVAVEDLCTVTFTLAHASTEKPSSQGSQETKPNLIPRVTGCRAALSVILPVPEVVMSLLPPPPAGGNRSFHVTPVFFNIGINEKATLAEGLGKTKPQEKSNIDNFERLNDYYNRYKKISDLSLPIHGENSFRRSASYGAPPLANLVEGLKVAVHSKKSKNVEVLHLASAICRSMNGLRFTSCKSAKDRTGMAATLEQCNILVAEYNLSDNEVQRALDCMRSEGCRMENTRKNIGVSKYAFNTLQLLTFPKQYRPPAGTFGSSET